MMSHNSKNDSLYHRQMYKSICGWFESWMPWQRQHLLCGATERCCRTQLEYLATALEPVFHRDFATSLCGQYPTRLIFKRNSGFLGNEVKHALPASFEDTDDKLSESGMHKFVHTYIEGVIQSVLQKMASTTTSSHCTFRSNEGFKKGEECEDINTPSLRTVDHRVHSEAVHTFSCSSIAIENKLPYISSQNSYLRNNLDNTILLGTQSRAVLPPLMEISSNSELTSDNNKSGKSSVQRKQISERHSCHERCGTFPPDNNSDIAKFSAVSSIDRPPANALLQQLSSRRIATFTWCLNHQMNVSCATSKSSSAKSEVSSHKHRTRGSSLTASTQDFFSAEKLEKLGPYHRALRTGKVKDLCQIGGIPVAVQDIYKPSRMWSRESRAMKPTLFPANRVTLKQHFKDQLATVWQWMNTIEDHEKTEFLVGLLKLCDQDLLKFFSKCLTKRLEECNNINSLSDKLLLYVLSSLSVDDLMSARLVCKRWKYIASHDELWREKVFELGLMEGILDLDDMLLDCMKNNSIDWRAAYCEMLTVITNAKEVKVPHQKVPQVKDELRNYCEHRVKEFLERIRPRSLDVDEDSSSSDSPPPQDEQKAERTASGVVELPVTFMATTQSQIDAITGKGEDENEAGTPQDEGSKEEGRGAVGRRAMRRQDMSKRADFALDVRPDPGQAQDLLSAGSSRRVQESSVTLPKRIDGIKPIKRVRRLQGHMDAVCTLMFDRRRIITGSMDHSIRVWDIRSGRSIKKIYGHLGGIRCLQFNEQYIVSGSWDMSIRVWDIVKFTQVALLSGHSGVVSCLQFNKNYLVSGSHDKSVRVWSMTDFKCRSTYKHHQGAVTCLVFHNQFVVSGSTDRTVKICDIETGICVMSLCDATDPISAVHVRGNLILAATTTGQLFCWREDKCDAVAGLQLSTSPIYRILFTPDTSFGARFLIGLGDGSIQEWDLVTMTCLRALYGHKGAVRDVQSSSDRIVSCSDDGNVRIWDLMPPPLRVGDKADKDTIATTTIHQRRDSLRN